MGKLRSVTPFKNKDLVRAFRHQGFATVLSFDYPGPAEQSGHVPKLQEEYGLPVSHFIQTFWDTEDEITGGPSRINIARALLYLRDRTPMGPIVISDHQGRTQAAAMMLGYLVRMNPKATIDQALDRVKYVIPAAAPNRLMVRYLDEFIGLNGALLKAVEQDPILQENRRRLQENLARYPDSHPPMRVPRPQ